jgi:hypothetical protein
MIEMKILSDQSKHTSLVIYSHAKLQTKNMDYQCLPALLLVGSECLALQLIQGFLSSIKYVSSNSSSVSFKCRSFILYLVSDELIIIF